MVFGMLHKLILKFRDLIETKWFGVEPLRDYDINHTQKTEGWFLRKTGNNMAYDTGSIRNGNIHLQITEEPKHMMI